MRFKALIVLLASLAATGCTWNFWYGDFTMDKALFDPVPFHRISIGYDKTQVEAALGPPPLVVGAKRFEDGIVEVWEYQQWEPLPGPDRIQSRHWIYFLDGEVYQWGRPGDWQREADKIYEIRHR